MPVISAAPYRLADQRPNIGLQGQRAPGSSLTFALDLSLGLNLLSGLAADRSKLMFYCRSDLTLELLALPLGAWESIRVIALPGQRMTLHATFTSSRLSYQESLRANDNVSEMINSRSAVSL